MAKKNKKQQENNEVVDQEQVTPDINEALEEALAEAESPSEEANPEVPSEEITLETGADDTKTDVIPADVKEEPAKDETNVVEAVPEPFKTAQELPATPTISEPKQVSEPVTEDQKPVEKKKKRVFRKGMKIELNNEPVYSLSTGRKESRNVTGTYYIYDGVNYNGSYRICTQKRFCGKGINYIFGYIKA